MKIREFMNLHYRHFNARETREAAHGWVDHLARGGKMFLTIAGAMSTAELGISLARMIRAGKVHGICSTAANLEEDVFNLMAHDDYRVIPRWRELNAADEAELYEQGLNRVTDTCIPETVMRNVDSRLLALWQKAQKEGRRGTPYEFMSQVLGDPTLREHFQIPPEHSWVLACIEKKIPVWTPGWEDSTLGNMFVGWKMRGELDTHSIVKSGTEQMEELARWYMAQDASVGFFQIGGGIAGDFPICVVPMLIQDVERAETPFWGYFCQISDSTTSYGSYSGAIPNEKITWGKLAADTPTYMINSDASIVAPLIFAYVLDE